MSYVANQSCNKAPAFWIIAITLSFFNMKKDDLFSNTENRQCEKTTAIVY